MAIISDDISDKCHEAGQVRLPEVKGLFTSPDPAWGNLRQQTKEKRTTVVERSLIMGDYYQVPEEYRPITMWGYFGYSLLFAIPLVGFILICVFSFGGSKNVNLRNFARSYFCWLIIGVILSALVFALGGTAVFTSYLQSISARA